MASKISTSSHATGEPTTQTDPKRPLMPQEFLEAAMDGDIRLLKHLLGLNNEEQGQSPHNNEEQDQSPHTNVSIEDITPMEPSDYLRSVTAMGDTILHILSAYGPESLISSVCTIDSSLLKARNIRNETPFHHATRYGYASTILKLIECAKSEFGESDLKELLRQKNCLGETALHEAVRYDRLWSCESIAALMEADLELAGLVNDDFVSPLYLATAGGCREMVQIMVEKLLNHEITPAFYSGPKQQTALHAAVVQYTGLAEEILKLYSETLGKAADEAGRTPLHFIAVTGDCDMARLLLDKDRSLAYIQDSNGSFPLHIAARMGHVKMILVLLRRCLDSGDLLDGNGRNFLHIAIETNNFGSILKFVNDSENHFPIYLWERLFSRMVNTMDNKGNTPLHLAAENGTIDFIYPRFKNTFLEWNLQNKEGLTAVDTLMITGKTKIGEIFDESLIQKHINRLSPGLFHYYNEKQESTKDARGAEDARDAKESPESVIARAQLMGLGSVLIATVTFAAAFTLPGGINPDTGNPILGTKYLFKAFVLADFSAFCLSIMSTMILIYNLSSKHPAMMEGSIDLSMRIFAIAARCMVVALALGLYLVIGPGNPMLVVFVLSSFLIFSDNPYFTWHQGRRFMVALEDPDTGLTSVTKDFLRFLIYIYVPILAPLAFIFLFALI